MNLSRSVTAAMAAIDTIASGNGVLGANGVAPEGCTESKDVGNATWSATRTPSYPHSSATRASSSSSSMGWEIIGSQYFTAGALRGAKGTTPLAAQEYGYLQRSASCLQ